MPNIYMHSFLQLSIITCYAYPTPPFWFTMAVICVFKIIILFLGMKRVKEKGRKGKTQTHIFPPLCLRLKWKCKHFRLRLGTKYESKDFFMAKIRDYKMNGTILLGVDAGYGIMNVMILNNGWVKASQTIGKRKTASTKAFRTWIRQSKEIKARGIKGRRW